MNRSAPKCRRALTLILLMVVLAGHPALARYQTNGFILEELVAAGGAEQDPGTDNLQLRLRWAVEPAIPPEWRESVRVVWTVGNVSRGHLALSYRDGRIVLSPRLMMRSAEEVLATAAHEFGHQIAFALVSPVVGMPPQGFIDLAPSYNDVREGWADCVARVWTGSVLRTLSEAGPCDSETAGYVAGLLADPATLGATVKITPPPIMITAPAAPAPVVTQAPAPEPDLAPVLVTPVVALPAPARPDARAGPAPSPAEPAGSSGLGLVQGLTSLPLALCVAGYWLVRRRSDGLLAWATGSPKPKADRNRLRPGS
ncbi:MAG: hypothetical protein WD178_03180 [Actinomycetota bacterium]